ncbi:MAG: hypothetical protein JW722_01640 [Demequinaceae bacterium]|nr:hypothetical protein [Demequinaceae bacterium]
MHGGAGEDDEKATDPSQEQVSPYLKPNAPERRSVIPPSKEIYTFPSGRQARPVEHYLVPEDPPAGSPDVVESGDDEVTGERRDETWPNGAESDSGDDGSRGVGGLPKWALWAGLGAVGAVVGILALTGGFSPSPVPSGSASPTGSVGPATPSFFDDGIAPEEYPEAAAWRGEGYPQALEMADWVWDRIGPQWAIVLMTDSGGGGTEALPIPVFYLVSPEGVYFELAELPSGVANGATLVSWHEDERTARIVWDAGTRGGLLHLETGEVENTRFHLSTGWTSDVQFLAANAAGKEVWLAYEEDGLHTELRAWTPEADWEQILPGQDDLYLEWYVNPARSDGSALAFQVYTDADSRLASSRSLPPGSPNLVVYWLDTGESRQIIPAVPYAEPDCWFTGWLDLVSVGYRCWDDANGVETDFRIIVDGSAVIEEDPGSASWFSDLQGAETVRNPDGTIELEVDSASGSVRSVRVLRDDGMDTVVGEDSHFGGSGRTIASFDEIAPDVLRLVTDDGIVIGIDTATAAIGPTIVAMTDSGVPLMGRSHIFFGEATPPGAGLPWD